MKFFSILFSILCVCSCGPIIKVAMGIKSPRFMTDEEVSTYANKNFTIDTPIYRIKNFEMDSLMPLNVASLPTMKFVSNNEVKKVVITCTADYSTLIKAPIDSLQSLEIDLRISNNELGNIFYNCSKEEIIISKKPTFYIYYANYAGKLNAKNINPWIESLQQRDDIDYVLVNCDPSIESSSKEKVKFKIDR